MKSKPSSTRHGLALFFGGLRANELVMKVRKRVLRWPRGDLRRFYSEGSSCGKPWKMYQISVPRSVFPTHIKALYPLLLECEWKEGNTSSGIQGVKTSMVFCFLLSSCWRVRKEGHCIFDESWKEQSHTRVRNEIKYKENPENPRVSHPHSGYWINKQNGGMKLHSVCKEVDCFPRAFSGLNSGGL